MAARANLILDALNKMELTAFNVGDDDFNLGESFLLSLQDRANFPFLSANIFSKEYDKLLFEESIIREIEGVKVGIIGITWDGSDYPSAVNVKDPVESAQRALNNIRDKVDIIIAITHMPTKVEMAFAGSLEEIDIIIGGHDGKRFIKPKLVSGRGIYKTGTEGKNLGKIDLKIRTHESSLTEITGKLINLKGVKKRLARLEENLRGNTIEEYYEENKQDAARLEELKARRRGIIEEINSANNTASFELINLTDKYASDNEIGDIVSKFREHFPKIEDEETAGEELLFDEIESD